MKYESNNTEIMIPSSVLILNCLIAEISTTKKKHTAQNELFNGNNKTKIRHLIIMFKKITRKTLIEVNWAPDSYFPLTASWSKRPFWIVQAPPFGIFPLRLQLDLAP